MAVTVSSSGTQTATVSTEHTLVTATASGVYALLVDTVNMLNGDELELRITAAVLSDGTRRLGFLGTFKHVQADPLKVSVPVVAPNGVVATLTQTAGTGRAYPWSLVTIG